MKTIPQIAEDLRAHINTDNAAPRLICESILPLLGVEVDTVQELEDAVRVDHYCSELREEVSDVLRKLEAYVEENYDDGTPFALEIIEGKLKTMEERLTL